MFQFWRAIGTVRDVSSFYTRRKTPKNLSTEIFFFTSRFPGRCKHYFAGCSHRGSCVLGTLQFTKFPSPHDFIPVRRLFVYYLRRGFLQFRAFALTTATTTTVPGGPTSVLPIWRFARRWPCERPSRNEVVASWSPATSGQPITPTGQVGATRSRKKNVRKYHAARWPTFLLSEQLVCTDRGVSRLLRDEWIGGKSQTIRFLRSGR